MKICENEIPPLVNKTQTIDVIAFSLWEQKTEESEDKYCAQQSFMQHLEVIFLRHICYY